MTTQRPMRVAVTGTGRQMGEHLYPALLELHGKGEIELVGACDVAAERAVALIEQYSSPAAFGSRREQGYVLPDSLAGVLSSRDAYGSQAEMIRATRPDGVVIGVPNRYHATTTNQAMKLGCHARVEKPMGVSIEECNTMLDTSEREDRVLQVGYQYADAVGWVRDLIRREKRRVVGVWGLWHREEWGTDDAAYFEDPETAGASIDLPGHLVAAILSALDAEPLTLRAVTSNARGREMYGERFRADDTLAALLELNDGTRVRVDATYLGLVPPSERLGLTFFFEGDEELDHPLLAKRLDAGAHRPVLRAGNRTEVGPEPFLYSQAMVASIRNWVRASMGEEELLFTPRHARNTELVIHGWRRAARTEGWVSLR